MADLGTIEGKAAVREFFFERLKEAGMIRAPRCTVEEFEKFEARLLAALAYMDPDNLKTLAQIVMIHATGAGRNVWPCEATIRNFARDLQAPPDREARIIYSWLASIEGPRALAAGHLVELYEQLRRHPFPPNSYAMGKIISEAADNARRVERCREKIERGTAEDDDRKWLGWYLGRLEYCKGLVARGEAARREAAEKKGGAEQ